MIAIYDFSLKKIHLRIFSLLFLALLFSSCSNILLSSGQNQTREKQEKLYPLQDRQKLLKALVASLQDEGYLVESVNNKKGIIRGKKHKTFTKEIELKVHMRGEQGFLVESEVITYNFLARLSNDLEDFHQRLAENLLI